VSSLPAQGFRPEQVIPLAFHVDYWDSLGWPDRFAKAVFTQRQRAMQAHQQASPRRNKACQNNPCISSDTTA
jgi:hypothetical protein